ncbi:MAG TPA: hypothetical protein VHY22_07250 [Chthoniobacteraceae bacterium]|jgi:hypothetical protein|nr:hypothetical protein [Chthoniobacteraceae bacterium]
MKSIKPGRGPSAIGAVGSLIGIGFGIFWTVMALTITKGAPVPFVHVVFPLFGLLFIGTGIVNLVYNATNATSKKRMSAFDITDEGEEQDPLDTLIRGGGQEGHSTSDNPSRFCPYCGTGLTRQFKFCPSCGKRIDQ